MRSFIPEYVLLIAFLIGVLLLATKMLMVLAFRQNSYYGQKLFKSFFYYNNYKIKKTEEPRLKMYYRASNRINTFFYSIMMSCFLFYTAFHIAGAVKNINPGPIYFIADNSYNNNSLIQK